MFFRKKIECSHDRVYPDTDAQYCPDCGRYIENKWYLTRCACCNVKRKTIIKHGEIQPQSHYCPNCGAEEFRVELVATINFIDINFAVLVKEINEEKSHNRCQSWVDRQPEPLRLLGLHLT